MTSTSLMTLTGNAVALTEAEVAILAELQDEGNAYDMQPARVKVAPGGIGQFLMGDETARSFNAIVAISQKIRGYWPASGTGAPPLCQSPDGTHGLFNADPDQSEFEAATKAPYPHPGIIALSQKQPAQTIYDCLRCPLNQWGSEHQRRGGNGGKGKACKEMRRLLLLIDGYALPAVMSLPPTSIRAWDAYCSAHAAKRSAYFAVKTRFELDAAKAMSGETYNVVKVTPAGQLDAGQIAMVAELRRQYREMISGMPIDAAEYDAPSTNGFVNPAPTSPDEELPPFGDDPFEQGTLVDAPRPRKGNAYN